VQDRADGSNGQLRRRSHPTWCSDHHPQEDSMDIQLADVLLHIDETLSPERRGEVEERLRSSEAVVSVHNPETKPHLTLVQYRPDKVSAQSLLEAALAEGVHAELIGL
jgi:hypothetical protein